MGFPENADEMHVLNYCLLYTKYYIYIQRLFTNNELDLYACQTQIKLLLEIELKIFFFKKKERKPKILLNSVIFTKTYIIASIFTPRLCPGMLLSLTHELYYGIM